MAKEGRAGHEETSTAATGAVKCRTCAGVDRKSKGCEEIASKYCCWREDAAIAILHGRIHTA